MAVMRILGRTYLVEHRARGKGRNVVRGRLDDGADDVEHDGDDDELDAAKHVGDFSCCRL